MRYIRERLQCFSQPASLIKKEKKRKEKKRKEKKRKEKKRKVYQQV